MKKCLKLFYSFLFLFGALASYVGISVYLSPKVSALDYNLADYNVVYESANEPQCAYKYNLKSGSTTWGEFSLATSETLYNPTLADGGSIKVGIQEMICKHSNGDSMTMQAGDIVVLDVRLTKFLNDNAQPTLGKSGGYLQQFDYLGEQGIDVIDFDKIGETYNVGRVIEYWRLYARMSSSYSGTPYWGVSWKIRGESVQTNPINSFAIFTMSMIHLRPKSDVDYSTDLTDLKNALSTLHSDNSSTLNALNNLRSETQAQTDVIEEGNEEAQDRWEADKQEEAEREEQGKDDADELGSTFHFEIRNPFMGLLGLFTNNCPVSIPTIASMVGSNQTVYPCWFSQQTRSILTPVIGISASVLLFGFIVRGFLRKGNFSGGIEI